MATTINIESDTVDEVEHNEEENEENRTSDEKPPPKTKICDTVLPCLAVVVGLFLILAGITLGIYLGVIKPNKNNKPPINPDEDDPILPGFIITTKPPPSVGTTTAIAYKRPTLITTPPPPPTCYQSQNYSFLTDKDIPESSWKIGLFTGQVTHERMFSICDRINVESRRKPLEPIHFNHWKGALFFNNKGDEDKIDAIIKDNEKAIFQDGKKLLWTGVTYYYNTWTTSEGKWEAKYQNDYNIKLSAKEKEYRNFCKDINLEADLKKKGDTFGVTDLDKRIGGKIYVVKNYEKPNNCWELYTTKELAKAMGQPDGTIPRLPFACSFEGSDKKFSGNDAIPGNFKATRVLTSANGNYYFYNVSATLEDAVKECESHGAQLIQFKDPDEMIAFAKLTKWYGYKAYNGTNLFWSGSYMDASNGQKRDLIVSSTWNRTLVSYTDDWKVMGKDLVHAAENLIASIKVHKGPRECGAKDHVYLGMSFSEFMNDEMVIFKALNGKGQLDMDSFRAYVACHMMI